MNVIPNTVHSFVDTLSSVLMSTLSTQISLDTPMKIIIPSHYTQLSYTVHKGQRKESSLQIACDNSELRKFRKTTIWRGIGNMMDECWVKNCTTVRKSRYVHGALWMDLSGKGVARASCLILFMWIGNIHAQMPTQFLQVPTKKKKKDILTCWMLPYGEGNEIEAEGKRQWSESTIET